MNFIANLTKNLLFYLLYIAKKNKTKILIKLN